MNSEKLIEPPASEFELTKISQIGIGEFIEGEKDKLLEKVRLLLIEVERNVNLKENELLTTDVQLVAVGEREKDKVRQEIIETEIMSGYRRGWEENESGILKPPKGDKLNAIVEKFVRSRALEFSSHAIITFRVIDKNSHKELGLCSSNKIVFEYGYGSKGSGETTKEELAKEVAVELENSRQRKQKSSLGL